MDMMDASMGAIPVDLDVDGVDLFGDPVSLMPPMPPTPVPSSSLQQRVDEMRSRGCCSTIAWSKMGTVASVSQDGRSVDLRYLRTNPADGSWGLSEPTQQLPIGTVYPGTRIVHLSWGPGPLGTVPSVDLAIIDDTGRISWVFFLANLNRPFPTRNWDLDPVDNLHAVVGCFWLPIPLQGQGKPQFTTTYGPAVRDGNKYKYETGHHPTPGPMSNISHKSAFLCVTSNGLLRMFYIIPTNNKVQHTMLEIESISSADDMITHASICCDKSNHLYVALAQGSKQLKILQVQIHGDNGNQGDKPAPFSNGVTNLTLKQTRVAMTSWLQTDLSASASHLDPAMTQISLLELLPTTSTGNQTWAPALVLAVRSNISSSYDQELQSIVDAWEILEDQPQNLHSAFQQLSSRNGVGSAPQATTRLRKLDSIVFNKIVVSIGLIQAGRTVGIAFSDGTIQHRDRVTLTEITTSPDLERIMTPTQVGFHYAEETPCLQVAFSPTGCSFAQISEDGKIKWNKLRFPAADIGSTLQDAQYHAVIAGLAIAICGMTPSSTTIDDILAVARSFNSKPRFAIDLVTQIITMLKIMVDHSEESSQDALVRNNGLQLCFSILNHLGFNGEFSPRSFSGRIAAITIHIRNILIVITIANTPTKGGRSTPLDDPDVVGTLASCTKWMVDLIAYLTDCLFELQDDAKFMELVRTSTSTPTAAKEYMAYLQSKGEVAMHLLMCSSSRCYMDAVCRRLIQLEAVSKRTVAHFQGLYANGGQQLGTGPERENQDRLYAEYQKILRHTSSSMVSLVEFERMLSGLGADVRAAYETMRPQVQRSFAAHQQQQGGGGGDASQNQQQQLQQAVDRQMLLIRNQCETQLLQGVSPLGMLMPVIKKLFETDLEALKQAGVPNRGKMYFHDFSSLGILDYPFSLKMKRQQGTGRFVDAFTHEDLGRPPQATDGGGVVQQQRPLWRRCARCASIMEDNKPNQKPGFTYVAQHQRKCCCGGHWGLLERGAVVG